MQTLPDAQIEGIADASMERARPLAQQFGIPRASGSLDELRDVQPNVIHILTPPASHRTLAVEALGLDCDVFVETPMAGRLPALSQIVLPSVRSLSATIVESTTAVTAPRDNSTLAFISRAVEMLMAL